MTDSPVPADAVPGEHLVRALHEHHHDAWVLLRAIRDHAGDVVDFQHEWSNAAADRGADRALAGTTVLEMFGPGTAKLLPTFRDVLRTGMQCQLEFSYDDEESDDSLRSRVFRAWLLATGRDHVACQYRDITDLRRAEHRLRHQAAHDELTGLPNRRLLREHLDRALAGAGRGGSQVVLLLGDLDKFKDVNDTYGHSAGDYLLQMVAARLRGTVRTGDLVARYGGDEFVVVSEETVPAATAVLADRIRTAVAGDYRLPDATVVNIEISLGTAVASAPTSVDHLLAEADEALYIHKRHRRGLEGPLDHPLDRAPRSQ